MMAQDFWTDLASSLESKDLTGFDAKLTANLTQLKPRVINETILKCLDKHADDPMLCQYIELFMHKLHVTKCSYICWDDTCKTVVRLYLKRRNAFSKHSMCFLLRCSDIELVKEAFEAELVDQFSSDCYNWHLMFIASYQDRFISNCFYSIYDGFLVKSILVCKYN